MKNMENLYQHGGNIYEIKQRRKTPVLDFSANINPLGIPPRIKKLLNKQLKDLVHYPDPRAFRLVAALARYWKIKEENVLVGNGSTELIYLILNAFRPDKVILPVPSFTEYERAARISGSQVRFIHMLEGEGFCLNLDHINNCDMLFMCNPNNPTGNLIVKTRADIENIPAKRIVIDEAFMDYVHNEQAHTFIAQATRSKKFIVLRTLTKFFALPGLRVGYVIAHEDNIKVFKRYQMPWSVNVLAQAAAEHVLNEDTFIQRSKQLIERERVFLYESLGRIKGLKPYPSVTNFLLIKIEDEWITSTCLKKRLLKKGILIRDCVNFRGLDRQFIRVAVRSHKENIRLMRALEECV
ncbi:MAG: threonine-phosphate decarboxylase CobD [Candidatus Omnitrophota bacterium]|nr:threonine-phosphate decarboxylase CobD [Candidatus Omnitrophota bacterium]